MTLETLAKLSHQKNKHFDASPFPLTNIEKILSHSQKYIKTKSN